MDVLAQIIAGFLVFVWIPYMCFCVVQAVWCMINPFPFLKTLLPTPKAVTNPVPPLKKSTAPTKRSKRSYRVEASFREEYRITNPVEFDT